MQIAGLETNVNFLLDLARHPEFVAGNVHTNFIKDNESTLFREEILSDEQVVQAAMALVLLDELDTITEALDNDDQFNPFVVESGFRVNHNFYKTIKLKHNDEGQNQQVQ